MRVYRDLEKLPLFRNAVITIGTFDGVHSGHCQIIAQLKEEAKRINGETVIITFDPHPRKIIAKAHGEVRLLTTLDERIELLNYAGINHLVIVAFDLSFASLSAEEYIKDFLYKNFKPHTIIIGYDHRFGKGRVGDYHLMDQYGDTLGFKVKEISEQVRDEVIVSSTRIRNALIISDIATANSLLGYNYFFAGTVMEGNKLGRTIGYPTANLRIENEEKLVPGNGVYAVTIKFINKELHSLPDAPQQSPARLSLADDIDTPSSESLPLAGKEFHTGMMNIGLRPTINGKTRVIEVNIFNFDQDIYGQTIRVYIKHYIRSEIKFNSLDELKLQLLKDKEQVIRLFNK